MCKESIIFNTHMDKKEKYTEQYTILIQQNHYTSVYRSRRIVGISCSVCPSHPIYFYPIKGHALHNWQVFFKKPTLLVMESLRSQHDLGLLFLQRPTWCDVTVSSLVALPALLASSFKQSPAFFASAIQLYSNVTVSP